MPRVRSDRRTSGRGHYNHLHESCQISSQRAFTKAVNDIASTSTNEDVLQQPCLFSRYRRKELAEPSVQPWPVGSKPIVNRFAAEIDQYVCTNGTAVDKTTWLQPPCPTDQMYSHRLRLSHTNGAYQHSGSKQLCFWIDLILRSPVMVCKFCPVQSSFWQGFTQEFAARGILDL